VEGRAAALKEGRFMVIPVTQLPGKEERKAKGRKHASEGGKNWNRNSSGHRRPWEKNANARVELGRGVGKIRTK